MALEFAAPRDTLNREERLSEEDVFFANKREMDGLFVNKLGVNVRKPGDSVAKSPGGTPRIFILKDGKVSTLEENNVKTCSKEFWETAIKGQLFAYRPGEKYPVQITARKPEGMALQVSLSEPLDPEKPPLPSLRLPVAPKKPNIFQRLFKFGGNRAICDAYDNYLREDKLCRDRHKATCDALKAAAKTINDAYRKSRIADFNTIEKEEHQALLDSLAEERALEKAKVELSGTRDSLGRTERSVNNAMSMYQPKPVKHEEWVKGYTGDDAAKVYTEEQFRELKPLTTDVNAIQIGGEGVSDREFSALAMFAALDPKIGMAAQKLSADPRPLIDSFQQAGYTQTEAEEIVTGSVSEIYTQSLMQRVPRSDAGNYFRCAVQPGREKAQSALDAYRNGEKAQLADILARTVAHAGSAAHKSSKLDWEFFGKNRLALSAVDLMERDPELKELAREKYARREESFRKNHPDLPQRPGFDEQVNSIRQVDKLEQLRDSADKSRAALLDARIQGKELSPEEKANHTKTILKSHFLSTQYLYAVSQRKKTKEFEKLTEIAASLPESTMENTVGSGGGSSLPASPMAVFIPGMEERFYTKPDALHMIDSDKTMRRLEQRLDLLVKQDALAEASTRALCDKLCSPAAKEYSLNKLADKLLVEDQPVRQQTAPEKTLERRRDVQAQELNAPKL